MSTISVHLLEDSWEHLKALSERTRVPQAAYSREAVEDLLKKYEEPKKKANK